MKTAMQEDKETAIEWLIRMLYSPACVGFISGRRVIPHEIIKQALEKEKEQIIDAGNACSIKTIVHRENLDKMSEDELRNSLVEDTISHGEDYYNQTYNQINGIEVDAIKSQVTTTTGVWTPKTN